MDLCYKLYETKMSLKAIKTFKQETGKDLWCLLISMIEMFAKAHDLPIVERMRMLYEVTDFETASHAMHCLITDKTIPLEEIQDGMFRVGWMPTIRDGVLSEPWPMVLLMTAHEIDNQFNEIPDNSKKKADILDQSDEPQK